MKPTRCPQCRADLEERRPIWKLLMGAFLVLMAFLLFLPTIGVSFILGVYGVFMMIPRRECVACQWHE